MKVFEDPGLPNNLLEAETVAQWSQPGVIKSRHFNRGVRVIKNMAEALRRELYLLSWTDSEEEKDKFIALSKILYHPFSKALFQHHCTSNDFKEFESKLSLFI